MIATCEVCYIGESKYKCPDCRLPYCSIGCYRNHKPSHTTSSTDLQSPPITNGLPPKPPPTVTASEPLDHSNYVSKLSSRHHASALETRPEFQRLLTMFPELRALLYQIYNATQESSPQELEKRDTRKRPWRGGRSGRGGGRSRYQYTGRPWTKQQGWKDALQLLRRMRAKDGSKGAALREFSEIVVKSRSGQTGQAQS